MKRIIAFVLMLVLVFSFSVPSFAVTADEQSTSLKSGWGSTSSVPSYPSGYSSSWFYIILYHTYQIRTLLNNIDSDTGNMLIQLQNIASDISSIELDVSSIESDVDTIRQNSVSILTAINNVISYVDELESSLSTTNSTLSSILSDTDMLQKVLADEDDLAFKNSQKRNEEAAIDNFFNPNNDLSVKPSDITYFYDLFGGVLGSYNFKEYIGSENPLSLMGEGSDFMSFFSDETGKAINPDFTGSNSGMDSPPPVEPPVFVSPNILRSESYTSWDKNTIFNTFGYKNNRAFQFFSENLNIIDGDVYNFVTGNERLITPDIDFVGQALTGYIPVTFGDEFFFYDVDFNGYFIVTGYDCDFSSTGDVKVNQLFYKSFYNTDFTFDENGVYSFVFDLWENESIDFVRFQVGSFSMDSVITRNEYPIDRYSSVNLLPSALEFPGLDTVLGGTGFLHNYSLAADGYDGIEYSPLNNYSVTGFMPFDPSKPISLSSDLLQRLRVQFFFINPDTRSYDFTQITTSSFVSIGDLSSYFFTEDDVLGIDTYTYFCCIFSNLSISSSSVITQAFDLPSSVMKFSAPRPSSDSYLDSEIVTSYASDRQKQFEFLVGGGS